MIKCILVDDEQHVHNRFLRVTSEFDSLRIENHFYSHQGVIEYIKNNLIDVVFLDIEMPIMNGLELAQAIMDLKLSIHIVFLTAYGNYAVDAFEQNATDYLLKPITYKRLSKTLERITVKKDIPTNDVKVDVSCFGEFIVRVNGNVINWKNQKVKELFAFLIHKNGVPVNWEQIADVLWQDKDYKRAHSNVNVNIYRLRKILQINQISELIQAKGYLYSINKDMITCDYHSYEETGSLPISYQPYLEQEGYQWAYEKSAQIDQIYWENK